jgi:hypothetical protein
MQPKAKNPRRAEAMIAVAMLVGVGGLVRCVSVVVVVGCLGVGCCLIGCWCALLFALFV